MTTRERDLSARLAQARQEIDTLRHRLGVETKRKARYLDNARMLHGHLLALGHELPSDLEVRRQVRYL